MVYAPPENEHMYVLLGISRIKADESTLIMNVE